MNISLTFIRVIFILLCVLFFTTYATNDLSGGMNFTNALIGLISGCVFAGGLIATDTVFKKFDLRAFNLITMGLFFGFLLGLGILTVFKTALHVSHLPLSEGTSSILQVAVFLFSIYLGLIMTARASEELYVSIPFVKFKPITPKKKDILVDASILMDSRIIDLASSGLLDHHLIIPRFTLKELYAMLEGTEETGKAKARRSLDVVKKLEAISTLDLRYADSDFPEVKDSTLKLVRLARLMDANIITADINRIQQSSIEGIRVINIHSLSNALKPITQTGEYVNIKIQRYGKEPRQGVGYLDDGTMVVVNGGAEYIGETIKAQVLSVKHTSSGRMIFCNSTDESLLSEQEFAESVAELYSAHKPTTESFKMQY